MTEHANDEQAEEIRNTSAGGYGTPAPEDEVAGDSSAGTDDLDAGGYGSPAPEDEVALGRQPEESADGDS
jgi:hypothetical protein